MGVLPLQFTADATRKSLELDGDELVSVRIPNDSQSMEPRQILNLVIQRKNGEEQIVKVQSRIDTENEIEYVKSGGILQYVLDKLIAQESTP